MTLLETERLARKITDLLRQPGNSHITSKLAEDFSAACHGANLRLQQCEAMIRAGDDPQALQLAETAPSLLDLVTLLEFLGCDEWREYCQQRGLPVAERIDARAVRSLNACYGKGITTDHPLYALYRRGVLSRNDEAALRALQSITRINPSDANAASELERLDAKVLAKRLEGLGRLLELGDRGAVPGEIEAIEAFGFKTNPQGDIWRGAQLIRCEYLTGKAAAARATGDWAGALASLELIERLKGGLGLEFAPLVRERIEALEVWARGEQEKDNREREFASLIGDLNQRIDASERKDTSSRFVELPELREDFENLHKVWRALVDFARTIPEEVSARFRKRAALLEGEIARRTAIRRRILVGTVALALVIMGTVGWWVLRQGRILDFTSQLRAAVEHRQIHPTEKLLERLRGRDQSLLSVGRVNTLAGEAEALLNKEGVLLTNFNDTFAGLPQHPSGRPDAARITDVTARFAATHKALDALAPDLKSENEPRVQEAERQWQRYCAEAADAVNRGLEPLISQVEKDCQTLDYRAPVADAKALAQSASAQLDKAEAEEGAFTNHLQLRGDLLTRTAAARVKVAAFEAELKKLDDGMAALRRARTLKEFSEGIGVICSSEFSSAPEALAAVAMRKISPSEETALRSLLGADASAWAVITHPRVDDLTPEAAMPSERDILRQLSQDPAIGPDHWHYRFILDPAGSNQVEWVMTSALPKGTGWQKVKAWAPAESPAEADFKDREIGYFDGQYRLSPSDIIYRVELSADSPEKGSSLNLQKVWNGGSTYSEPLLGALDAIKNSREGSPLLRVFVFLRLTDLMQLQPAAWGVPFCPSVVTDSRRLRELGGAQIARGDWLLEERERSLAPKFEKFFASIRPVSYTRQAVGLLAADRAAARDGLQYAGFLDLTGKSVLIEKPSGRQLWVYDNETPVRVIQLGNGDARSLSPIFTLPKPAAQYLAEVGISVNDENFKGVLPPLFKEPAPHQP
jgi:hypothetical protein